ncbi:M56 family metallopeptidase [Hanstruepera ponticola]|uniref:M56 family metallopeptidase n=1 Tax=Hanstruepera ponticola TaxID=2042995 RepID=UPI00177B566C|nr:M56 family metallopeptidase [Hanstruepera ponticola]
MILYILKSSACLAVFMLFYKLFLEKESFHKFKRFYLLGTLIASVIIPLITFTTYVEVAPLEMPVYNSEVGTPPYVPEHMFEEPVNYWPKILWSIYIIGALVFTIRFGINLTNIVKRIKQNPKFKNRSVIHVLLNDLVQPHTFLNYIFFNKTKYEAHEIPNEVLLHEETHAKEKHALDILFIEILQIIFWFNLLLYFIKKDIKLNHEFLADQAVINHGFEVKSYQNTLLAFSSNSQEPQLANAINYSSTRLTNELFSSHFGQVKKRFTVMKTHTSKHIIWVRSLVLLPLLAILVYSFSTNKIVEKSIASKPIIEKQTKHQEINPHENINITISENGEIFINNIQADFETFESTINSVSTKLSNEDKNKILVSITLLEKNTEMGVLTDIKETLRNLGYSKFEIHTHQKGASKEQIAEYNKLAKHYNSQKGESYTIKLSDMKRIKYLYDLMTEEQRKSAEPFPNFPPPPPPAPAPESVSKKERAEYESMAKKAKAGKAYSYKYKDDNGKTITVHAPERDVSTPPPPPPPVPADATPEQKKQYKKAREEYYKKYKVENGKVSKREPLPPAPPKPMSVAQPPKAQQHYYDSLASFKYEGKLIKSTRDTQEIVEVPPAPPKNENPWGITTTAVVHYSDDENSSKILPIPSEHMKQLAEKNAVFFYNDKNISGKEAVKLTRENHNLHILVSNTSSNRTRVDISDRKPNIETVEIVEVPPPPPPANFNAQLNILVNKDGSLTLIDNKKNIKENTTISDLKNRLKSLYNNELRSGSNIDTLIKTDKKDSREIIAEVADIINSLDIFLPPPPPKPVSKN